jgi:hypothetical protein
VPFLRWKRGEQVALHHLSDAAKACVKPLILLASEQYKERKARGKTEARTSAMAFCEEAKSALVGMPFMLNAAELPDDEGEHPLLHIAESARETGLTFIPVARLDDPEPYLKAVQSVANTDGRGVALCVDLEEMTSAASWDGTWFCPPSDTDLIVDFADNVDNVAKLGEHAW